MDYIKPHTKKSRDVENYDVQRVLSDAVEMLNIALNPPGPYESARAVAHSQFESNDPLRFFVTADERIIVNPYIIAHEIKTSTQNEGCTSFPYYRHFPKTRWYKVQVMYLEFEEDEKGKLKLVPRKKHVTGREARMFQHEIEHMEGVLLYTLPDEEKPKEHKPKKVKSKMYSSHPDFPGMDEFVEDQKQ